MEDQARKIRRRMLLQGAAAASAAVSTPLLSPSAWARTRLSIATGGTGGTTYQIGAGLAKLLSEKLPNTQANAQVTGGSVDNVKLVASGEADIGFATLDAVYFGVNGEGPFKKAGRQSVRIAATLFSLMAHVIASRDLNIGSVADFRGKRVSVGSAGSATETVADRILAAAGLNPRTDIVREHLGANESAAALQDGKIAGFFFVTGVPAGAVRELATSGRPQVKFVQTPVEMETLIKTYPGQYRQFLLEANTYPGQAERVISVGVPNVMIVSEKASNAMVTSLLQTIFSNLSLVHAVHPDAKRLTLFGAGAPVAVPFHPAAESFYKKSWGAR